MLWEAFHTIGGLPCHRRPHTLKEAFHVHETRQTSGTSRVFLHGYDSPTRLIWVLDPTCATHRCWTQSPERGDHAKGRQNPHAQCGELPKIIPVHQATSPDLALRQAIVDEIGSFVYTSLAQSRVYDIKLDEWPNFPFDQSVQPFRSFHAVWDC